MDEISQGIRIIIERCETNPDEMMEEYGKWSSLRNALFDYMENRNPDRQAWLRGLRKDEINALYEAFGSLYRKTFDEYVMKNVLVDEEDEKRKLETMRDRAWHGGLVANNVSPNFKHPSMLQNQATLQPGSWQNVAAQTSDTSIATTLKNALGIK